MCLKCASPLPSLARVVVVVLCPDFISLNRFPLGPKTHSRNAGQSLQSPNHKCAKSEHKSATFNPQLAMVITMVVMFIVVI